MSTPQAELLAASQPTTAEGGPVHPEGVPDFGSWRTPVQAPQETPRTYRGRSIEELIPRIQQELGAEAIIVRRREGLTGGIAGFFQRRFVELEALPGGPRIDIYDEDPADPALPDPAHHPPLPAPATDPEPLYSPEPIPDPGDRSYVSEHLAALARSAAQEPSEQPADPPPATREFHGLRPEDFSDPFASPSAPADPPNRPWRATAVAPRTPPTGPTRARTRIERRLLGLGVSEQFACELIDGALAHVLPLTPRGGLARAVSEALIQRIPVAPMLPTQGAAIILLGPGGAGKTSCAAALLEAYRRGGILPASCATLTRDSQRGALHILLSPHIMRPTPINTQRAIRALQKTRANGMAVVDTPALSPADLSAVRELAGPLGELKPERVVVALPATLGAKAATQLLEALRPLGANALAITHADETDQIGVAVEVACSHGLAPEYLLSRGRPSGWKLSRVDPAGLAAMLLR